MTAWLGASSEARRLDRFRAAQAVMLRHAGDAAAVDVQGARCLVGHAGGAAYPVRTWTAPAYTVVFEGHVYDRSASELRSNLDNVFERAFAGADALPLASTFVGTTDGDFWVIAVAATGDRCIAFSDALGRLPIYVHGDGEALVLARECKFIAALQRGWSFDKLGLAQHFWLGYPLGSRTLFRGIERAPEGFFLDARVDGSRLAVRRASCYALRCDVKSQERDLRASAAAIVSYFVRATAGRASVAADAPAIVSLSGGHDSRSVLAAMRFARTDGLAATFRRPDGRQAGDVRIADRLARALDVPWQCIDLPAESPDDEQRLVWMKDGLNYAAMAFIVPFLDEVVQRWSDRAVLLTGDGGDKVFPDLRPARRARTPEELAEILADENMLAPAAEVEGLLGLPAGTLLAELRAHVEQYPEPALEHKAVRMKIVERSRKWLFEGEDRNRCFLWQASPCFALPVFEAAMHVPDESKSGFRLYAEFQRQLEPVLLTLPHADSGMAIDSLRLRAYSLARRWGLRALGPLRRKVFRHPRGQPPAPPALRTDTLELLRAACAGESKLKVLLDERQAYDSVARSSRHSLYNWRTVLLLDQLWRQRIP